MDVGRELVRLFERLLPAYISEAESVWEALGMADRAIDEAHQQLDAFSPTNRIAWLSVVAAGPESVDFVIDDSQPRGPGVPGRMATVLTGIVEGLAERFGARVAVRFGDATQRPEGGCCWPVSVTPAGTDAKAGSA